MTSAVRTRTLRTATAFAVSMLAAAPAAPQLVQLAQNRAAQPSTAAELSDEEVKAAFLYNFGSYVQWPQSNRSDDTIDIAVLGAPRIAAELARTVRGRTIQGMPVRVRRLRAMGELNDDEVLFIGADENWRLAQLIESIAGRPTLIVTDAPDGLADGSMINFQLVDRRVRFEISLARAEDAGLMLSSRLLSAALRVETTRRGMEDPRPMEVPTLVLAGDGAPAAAPRRT